jgi:hypothetical protein
VKWTRVAWSCSLVRFHRPPSTASVF